MLNVDIKRNYCCLLWKGPRRRNPGGVGIWSGILPFDQSFNSKINFVFIFLQSRQNGLRDAEAICADISDEILLILEKGEKASPRRAKGSTLENFTFSAIKYIWSAHLYLKAVMICCCKAIWLAFVKSISAFTALQIREHFKRDNKKFLYSPAPLS